MNIFDKNSLKELLTGEGSRSENPLVQLGFGTQLLAMRLPEDQLWAYAKRCARGLVTMLHPDTAEEESPAARAAQEAFETLKNRRKFDEALAEIRREASEERTTENLAKRSERAKQAAEDDAVTKLQAKQVEYVELRDELERHRRRMLIDMNIDHSIMTNSEKRDLSKGELNSFNRVKAIPQLGKAILLRIDVHTRADNSQGSAETHERIMQRYAYLRPLSRESLEFKAGIEDVHTQMIRSGMATTRLDDLIQAQEQSSVPVLDWQFVDALKSFDVPPGKRFRKRFPDPMEVLSMSPNHGPEQLELYRRLFRRTAAFLQSKCGKLVSHVRVFPEIVDLRGGWLGKRLIVGSMFFSQVSTLRSISSGRIDLGEYPQHLPYKLLGEGTLLATLLPRRINLSHGDSFSRMERIGDAAIGALKRDWRMESTHAIFEFLDD